MPPSLTLIRWMSWKTFLQNFKHFYYSKRICQVYVEYSNRIYIQVSTNKPSIGPNCNKFGKLSNFCFLPFSPFFVMFNLKLVCIASNNINHNLNLWQYYPQFSTLSYFLPFQLVYVEYSNRIYIQVLINIFTSFFLTSL